MRILLTNDDGFEAEGLQCLYELLSTKATCFVVAPDRGRSCCGHAVTTGSPIDLEQRGENKWAISGTPADCVRIGLSWLKLEPDIVISGVNHGGNLGADIFYSGTVAAAREACLMGVRSIAVSQYMRRDVERDWNINASRADYVIEHVCKLDWPAGGFWSANLPALPPSESVHALAIAQCEPERQSLRFEFAHDRESNVDLIQNDPTHRVIYESNYQMRPRGVGSDVALCFSGQATLTWLSVVR